MMASLRHFEIVCVFCVLAWIDLFLLVKGPVANISCIFGNKTNEQSIQIVSIAKLVTWNEVVIFFSASGK